MYISLVVAFLGLGFIIACQGAVPEQLGIPVVGRLTSETVELSWTPIINVHTKPITHYIIMWRMLDEEWNEQNSIITADDSTKITVTGLLPYTRYSFRLTAVNSDGNSEPGHPSQTIITPRKAPSESPMIIEASSTRNTIFLSWISPPANALNGEFLGYRITYKELQRKNPEIIDIHDLTITNYEIGNLLQHTTYVITVQVYNEGGYGPDARIIIMTNKEECHCHPQGSVEGTSCDKYSGQCKCRSYVTGRDCDKCKAGYWNLNDSNDGCQLCLCDLGGALDGTCDMQTGQCECKANVVGLRCEVAAQGYFTPYLDFYTFEAEHNDKAENANLVARTPHPDRRTTWTDSGFMQVFEGSELEFYVTLTSSMFYDIMIRYESQLPDNWDEVRVIVQYLGPVEASGFCAESKLSDNVKLTKLNAGRRYVILSPSVCLEAGLKYTIKLEFLRYQSKRDNPNASVLIDSIILIPVVDDLPLFQDQVGMVRKNEFIRNRCRDTQIAVTKRELTPICQRYINSISFYIHEQALACGCDDVGSVHTLCSPIGGLCECKPNIIGRRCDHCAPGSYNFGPNGCSLCLCNKIGTVPSSSDCDSISGQCRCLQNVVGRQCDQCAPNYINLDSGKGCTLMDKKPEECNEPGFWEDVDGNCNPCDCALGGSVDTLCQPITGQCKCRPYVTGHRCNRPVPGYFVPYLDFHTYEAEYAPRGTNVKVITREPPANMTMTWTNIGFMQVFEDSELQFSIELPNGLEYDIILRYEAKLPETWDDVQLTIERPQPISSEGPCKYVSQIEHRIASLSPDSSYYVISPSVCLEANIQYSLKFKFGRYDRYQSTTSASIYLDSVILMPSIRSVPFFQGEGLGEINKNEFMQHGCIETQFVANKSDLSNICYKYISSIALFIQGQALDCSCDSTGSENADCSPLGGQCSCKRNVFGWKCDHCAPGTYNFGFEGCSLCKCNLQGIIHKLQACDSGTGQCYCLPNVTGRQCDSCLENHWNLTSGRGCEPCDCNPEGSISLKCNQFDGQCECLPGIGGRQCSECEINSWGDPNVQCQDCGCSVDGSSSLQCNKYDGSCICLPGITGDNCTECQPEWSGSVPYCYPCNTCLEELNTLMDSLAAEINPFIENNPQLRQSVTFDEESKILAKKIDHIKDIVMNAQNSNVEVDNMLVRVEEFKTNFTAAVELVSEKETETEVTETSSPTVSDALITLSDLKDRIKQVKSQFPDTLKNILIVQFENIQENLTAVQNSKQSEHQKSKKENSDEVDDKDDDDDDDDDDKIRINDILNKYKPIETAMINMQTSLKEIEDEIPDINELVDVSKLTPSPNIADLESNQETIDSNVEKQKLGYKSKIQKFLHEVWKKYDNPVSNRIKKMIDFVSLIEAKQVTQFRKKITAMVNEEITFDIIWSAIERDLDKGQRLRDSVNKLNKNASQLLKTVQENLHILAQINEQPVEESTQLEAITSSDDKNNDNDSKREDNKEEDNKEVVVEAN